MAQSDIDVLQMIENRLERLEDLMTAQLTGHLDIATFANVVRRCRDSAFPIGYFADTAWELLLELYNAHRRRSRLAISDLGLGAQIAPTTVLRYVDRLVEDGFAERKPDPTDKRRIFVALSDHGVRTMIDVFEASHRKLGLGRRADRDASGGRIDEVRSVAGEGVFL